MMVEARTAVRFPIRVHQEDGAFWAQGVPPLDGLFTSGRDLDELRAMAADALNLMLGSMLDNAEPIPRPALVEAEDLLWVEPDPDVAAPILLKWLREDAGLTQADLASRLNVTRQAVQRLERSDANPSIKTLKRVMRALGRDLHLAV